MARKRKPSDDIYNARRRFRRQAERALRKAQESNGATAQRYTQLAKDAIENAIRTYDEKSPLQGAVGKLAEELGIERDNVRMPKSEERRETLRRSLEQESMKTLANRDIDEKRDFEAREILKRENIGSRFYAGTIEIWEGKENINQAIIEYFGVESIMDVLELIEQKGIDIYSSPDESVSPSDSQSALSLQKYVAQTL